MENIIVRPLKTLNEFTQAIQVQKLAWNRDDYSLIPPTIFKSFSKNGGSVIGALVTQDNESEQVIGYAIGYLASTSSGILYHHSQQVAVLPEYQHLGIAYKLKESQKDFVQHQLGLQVMTWTVDPLLSKNAYLNYHKLGAIGRLYWVDYYGSREDDLNSGLETDRVEVEWWFNDPERSLIEKVRANIPEDIPYFDYAESGSYFEHSNLTSYLGVSIPRDLVVLKQKNQSLAIKLRKNFRILAQKLIEKGYVIIDIKSKMEPKSLLIWTNELKELKKLK